jgi:putative transposase
LTRVERSDFRLPVFVIYASKNGVLRRPVESAQYLSIRYTEQLAEAGIDTSVGSVGDSYDNALAESIIGLFKTEVIKFLGPWKSVGQVEWETLKWVDWYNNSRLHSAIGYVTPNEAEEAFYASLNAVEKVA